LPVRAAARRPPTQALGHPHRQQSTLRQWYSKHDRKEARQSNSTPTTRGANRIPNSKPKLQVVNPCLLLRVPERSRSECLGLGLDSHVPKAVEVRETPQALDRTLIRGRVRHPCFRRERGGSRSIDSCLHRLLRGLFRQASFGKEIRREFRYAFQPFQRPTLRQGGQRRARSRTRRPFSQTSIGASSTATNSNTSTKEE
jgi:hypothetical protein